VGIVSPWPFGAPRPSTVIVSPRISNPPRPDQGPPAIYGRVTEEGLADTLAEIVVRGMRGSGGQVHGSAPAAGADLERGLIPSRSYTSVDRRNDLRRPAAIVDRDVASGDSGFGAPHSRL
jgi:hypothetical protein